MPDRRTDQRRPDCDGGRTHAALPTKLRFRRALVPAGLGSALVATLLALAVAAPARAVSYTWNNAAGGNWDTATNWTPNGVPNATADTATITLAGTYTVTVVGSFTVGSVAIGGTSGTQTLSLPGGGSGGILTLNAGAPTATMTVNANGAVNQSGGTLQTSGGNTGQVTVNGRYDWSGGSVNYASFTVAPTGTLALAGVSVKSLQSLQLVNNGTMVNTGAGSLQIENNSTVTNAAGAVIDLQGDGGLQQNGGGNSVLTNAGLIRKTVGTGTANITTPLFNNTGVVDVQAGTLQVAAGSTRIVSSGAGNAFNAQAGATLNIGWVTNPSSFTGTTFGGPGAKTIGSSTSASYALAGTIAMTNTTFAGGSLAGTFTLNGTLAWTGGEMTGVPTPVVTVAAGSTLALSGVAEKRLSGAGASLVNNGTISIAGNGNLQVENNASLANSATGTIDLQSDAGITQSGGGTSTLTNAGLVRKSGGTGTSSITLASVTNNGTMQAQSGTLLISRNGGLALQASGPGNAFNAQAGAALTIGWVALRDSDRHHLRRPGRQDDRNRRRPAHLVRHDHGDEHHPHRGPALGHVHAERHAELGSAASWSVRRRRCS